MNPPTTTAEEYVEIPVTLKLKKNVAEAVKILSICYSDYPTHSNEMLNKFLSQEVTKIVQSLAIDPPYSDGWPENFKNYLKRLVINSEENDDLGLPSKEEVERRFGKAPPDDDDKEDLK